jgi:hypothetical protein
MDRNHVLSRDLLAAFSGYSTSALVSNKNVSKWRNMMIKLHFNELSCCDDIMRDNEGWLYAELSAS